MLTEFEYRRKVQDLKKVWADCPLLPFLSKNFDRWAVIYLNYCLANVPNAKNTPPSVSAEKSVGVGVESDDRDAILKKLYIQKSNLFVERAKWSNQLCDAPMTPKYDEQRAAIVTEIQIVQKAINDMFQTIAYAEAHGTLPNIRDTSNDIPTDAGEQRRQLVSLQASRARMRKDLAAICAEVNEKMDAENFAIFVQDEGIAEAKKAVKLFTNIKLKTAKIDKLRAELAA
jgi:hypothetical protein